MNEIQADRGVRRPESNGRVRVFVVDDHPIVRRGLADLLQDEPDMEVCGEAADFVEALREIPAKRPDVVLIDITLGGASGIELIQRIRSLEPDIRMVVVSMHDESMYAARALRAGATGYVKKDDAATKVVEAVRAAMAGHIYLSQTMSEGVLREAIGNPGSEGLSPVERLSNRELAVFDYLGSGMKTTQIALRLRCSPKTIETHRQNIKRKLNLRNSAELIAYAARWGVRQS
jgi:DNA-binding NarL/FixJ family response regulator